MNPPHTGSAEAAAAPMAATGVRRARVTAGLFWMAVVVLIAADLSASRHDRFSEPPAWALGHPARAASAHCSAAPAASTADD